MALKLSRQVSGLLLSKGLEGMKTGRAVQECETYLTQGLLERRIAQYTLDDCFLLNFQYNRGICEARFRKTGAGSVTMVMFRGASGGVEMQNTGSL